MTNRAGSTTSADRTSVTNERGAVTAFFVILALVFFAIAGVVAEGSRKLSNLSRAEDIAAEAARAAASTLSLEAIADGVARIDTKEERARKEANEIVDRIIDADIERFITDANNVLVVVRVRGDSFIPGFNIDGVGSHQAAALNPFG